MRDPINERAATVATKIGRRAVAHKAHLREARRRRSALEKDGAVLRAMKRRRAAEGLSKKQQAYKGALLAAVDSELTQVLRQGDVEVPPGELARRMTRVIPRRLSSNKMAEQIGPLFYDSAGVATILAVPGSRPISKQAVEQRRSRRTVLALQTSDGKWIYPTWQFVGHKVMPGLGDLLALFQAHSPWSVGTWLTTPSPELGDRTPIQSLQGDGPSDQLRLLSRRTAARWAV